MRKYNPKLIKLTKLLADGQYHDGDALGESLQMTRSAVWKMIKKLQQYGVAIESVKGKGYALRESLVLLDVDVVKAQSQIDVEIVESVDSTNKYLLLSSPRGLSCQRKLASSESSNWMPAFAGMTTSADMTPSAGMTPSVCLAEHQAQGVGRFNRHWHSPFGRNIYLSLRYHFHKDISELAGLSLVVSLSILQALKAIGVQQDVYVKWPNDILFEQKKLSGTLIEVQAESHGLSQAVIGIGINVNVLDDDNQISQPWTSLQKILGRYVDRNELAAVLINQLLTYLARFERDGFSAFRDEWIQEDCLTKKNVTINHLNHRVEGIVTGVNDQGHLMMQLSNGETKAYSSGEATIIR